MCQKQCFSDTHSIVLLEHQLITFILTSHRKKLTLKVHSLLSYSLRLLVIILHELLLIKLLLRKPLSLRLLSLTLLELASLLVLKLPSAALLFLPRSYECCLLLFVLLEVRRASGMYALPNV